MPYGVSWFPLRSRRRLTGARDVKSSYHAGLDPLIEAAARTRAGWTCMTVPLAPPGEGDWSRLEGRAAAGHKAFVLRQHLELVRRCRAAGAGPILVREFSTKPLLVVAGRLRRLRRRLWFVVNHNLQWTLTDRVERACFVLLDRLGFRFAFFETTDLDLLRRYGIDASRHAVLPHPVATDSGGRPASDDGAVPRVGVVGHYRAEKGADDVVARLAAAPSGGWRVVVGAPGIEAVRRRAPWRDAPGVETRDTSDPAEYRRLLSECAAVVLNNRRDAYEYRPSGILADAAGAGASVLAPDFPVLQVQIAEPVVVGRAFPSGGDPVPALSALLEDRRRGAHDFAAYRAGRSAPALAERLDAIADPGRGGAED
jgi:hypothetical protein